MLRLIMPRESLPVTNEANVLSGPRPGWPGAPNYLPSNRLMKRIFPASKSPMLK